MELVFDTTAIHASEMLSASLHGMLTNPIRRGFDLRYRNEAMNQDDTAKEYLEEITDLLHKAFQRSNFPSRSMSCITTLSCLAPAFVLLRKMRISTSAFQRGI